MKLDLQQHQSVNCCSHCHSTELSVESLSFILLYLLVKPLDVGCKVVPFIVFFLQKI